MDCSFYILKTKKGEKMKNAKILVFSTGGKGPNEGGSGFQELVENSRTHHRILESEIVGVVSNYPDGGVSTKAKKLNIPFEFMQPPFDASAYEALVKKHKADYVMLSGWLKLVEGLDAGRTINIHPGLLPGRGQHGQFGGLGKYGHHVHEAVIDAYKEGKITQTGFTIHFVNEKFDTGPIICQVPVLIRPEDTPETIAKRVNEKERAWQSTILNYVIKGEVYLCNHKVCYKNASLRRLMLGY